MIQNSEINNYLLFLAPIYLTSLMLIFVISRKWIYDKILMASIIASVFCLLSYSMGHINLAITIICTSNTVLVIYSMFFRRKI